MLATLPVDDPEPERGAGEGGEGKPAGLVAKAEPPALGDQVGVKVFAVVVGELEPASPDDRKGERFNVVDSVQRKLAGEHSGIQLCQANRLARALAEQL